MKVTVKSMHLPIGSVNHDMAEGAQDSLGTLR